MNNKTRTVHTHTHTCTLRLTKYSVHHGTRTIVNVYTESIITNNRAMIYSTMIDESISWYSQ